MCYIYLKLYYNVDIKNDITFRQEDYSIYFVNS
jgi:hypothetical protein